MGKADAAAAEREWKRAINDHAAAVFRNAIGQPPGVRSSASRGGTTVEIQGPDGTWRCFYVRLTPVAP